MAELEEVLNFIKSQASSFQPATSARNASEPRDNTNRAGELMGEESLQRTFKESSRPVREEVMPGGVAVIVALPQPELESVLSVFGPEWRQESRDGVIYNVAETLIGRSSVRIAVAVQNDMGMVPAAVLAAKTVRTYRPTLLSMVGICAGVAGKVSLGDVIIARQLFDYGSGKISNGLLRPDYQPIAVDDFVCGCAIDLASDRAAVSLIRDAWPLATGRPKTVLEVHVGAMASGAAVVADDNIVVGIQEHKRTLLGLDMEAYGVAKAAAMSIERPRCLIIKGVQDYADESKADDFREYSAFVSASILKLFLERYWGQL